MVFGGRQSGKRENPSQRPSRSSSSRPRPDSARRSSSERSFRSASSSRAPKVGRPATSSTRSQMGAQRAQVASSSRLRRDASDARASHARPRKDRARTSGNANTFAVTSRGKQHLGSVKIESNQRERSNRSSRQNYRSKGPLGFIAGMVFGLFGAVFGFIRKSKLLTLACVLVVVVAGGLFVDNIVNGKKIYENCVSPRHRQARDSVEITLQPGENVISARVGHFTWQWAVEFAIEGGEGLEY